MKRKMDDWLPSPDQELLLKSALSDHGEALCSWDKWKKSNDINNLDRGSYRLLPMVFHNLKDHIPPGSELYGKLKGTYRKSWFSNNMIMEAAVSLFSDLKVAGIDPLLLKGIHLINSYYDEIACRPIGDADFLVSWDEAERAGELIRMRGWRMKMKMRYPVFNTNSMVLFRSLDYINENGYSCDLHWNIIRHRCYPDADRKFLKRASEFRMKGVNFRGLCAEDLILHILEHGAYENPEPHIRWIPDVLMILRKREKIDWDLFLENVIMTDLVIPVKSMLEYMNDVLRIKKVEYPLRKLRLIQLSGESRIVYKNMLRSRTIVGRQYIEYLRRYSRYRIYIKEYKKGPVPAGISGLIRFFMFKWDVKCFIYFPFVFLKKFFDKIGRFLFRS